MSGKRSRAPEEFESDDGGPMFADAPKLKMPPRHDGFDAGPGGQRTFSEYVPPVKGETFEPEHDKARLGAQFQRVRALMADGAWRTLAEIATLTGDPEASVSARLRDIRRGGVSVARRRRGDPGRGIHEYRVGEKRI